MTDIPNARGGMHYITSRTVPEEVDVEIVWPTAGELIELTDKPEPRVEYLDSGRLDLGVSYSTFSRWHPIKRRRRRREVFQSFFPGEQL